MSTFSVGGLASGLDTKSIIGQLMDIEARPKQKLEWRSQLWSARKTAWSDLNTRLRDLQTAANALLSPSAWTVGASTTGPTTFGATSTNSGVATATVSGTPTAGTYGIDVLQLARGEVSTSSGNLGAATSGTFSTGAWYEGAANVVEGNENITALRTSAGATMGLNTNSRITMNYTVNGVAQSAEFRVNTLANGGQGTTLTAFQSWVSTTIGNGATASFVGGQLRVTTAPGTTAELDALSFSAVNAAGTALGAFNGSVGASGSSLVAASDGGVGAGGDTLTIAGGSGSWNVALAAGDQKQDIVNKINATSGIGVIASLVGSDIRLQSSTTGAASGFSVSSSGITAAQLNFVETQAAQDALFTVNGTASSSSTNNNINGAVTGLMLNLSSTGTSSITVAEQTASGQTPQEQWADDTKSKISQFVAQYNSVLDLVYQKTQAESKTINPKNLGEYLQGPLARDVRFSQVGFDLRQLTAESVTGLPSGMTMLEEIGISTTFAIGGASSNGRLTIDDAKLEAALNADPQAVQDILSKAGAGAGVTADDGILRRVSETISFMRSGGAVDTAMNGAGEQVTNTQRAIDRATERLERKRKQYERMYASLETSLGKLQSQGSWLSGQLAGMMQQSA